MNRIRKLTAVAVLIAAFWTGGAAATSDKPQPVPSRHATGIFAPDPEGVWRTVTQTDSTSDCIGDPVTPMCALDTRVACFLRKDDSLCSAVSTREYSNYEFIGKASPGKYIEYRVVTVHRTRAETVEPLSVYYPRYSAYYPKKKRKIGDILIGVIKRRCRLPEKNCHTGSIPDTIIFRQVGERWLIVDNYWLRY